MSKELQVIHFFSGLLSKIFDFEELLEVMVKKISEHFECERVSIVLLENNNPVLKMAHGFKEDKKTFVKNKKIDSLGEISKRIMQKKKTLCFE